MTEAERHKKIATGLFQVAAEIDTVLDAARDLLREAELLARRSKQLAQLGKQFHTGQFGSEPHDETAVREDASDPGVAL